MASSSRQNRGDLEGPKPAADRIMAHHPCIHRLFEDLDPTAPEPRLGDDALRQWRAAVRSITGQDELKRLAVELVHVLQSLTRRLGSRSDVLAGQVAELLAPLIGSLAAQSDAADDLSFEVEATAFVGVERAIPTSAERPKGGLDLIALRAGES